MENPPPTDAPRSMRDPDVRSQRKDMLSEPHIAPLTAFAKRLRERSAARVPDFDPLDGGIDARILFLFEKPGPMTVEEGKRGGSGFISRNNNDPTAEAILKFMIEAGIPRKATVIWNVIPWWNGTRKISKTELKDGVATLMDLIGLLPNLRAVVMVGARAASARPFLATTGLELFSSDHVGPMVRARWPDRWKAIPSEWAKVQSLI